MQANDKGRRPRRMRLGITFRWLMILSVTGFAFGAISVASGLSDIKARSDQAIQAWRIYANRTSDKERALRNFVWHVGFGTMIDGYKSYVMSGDDALAPDIYARAAAALGALDRYRQNETTAEEDAALAVLETIVGQYHAKVSVIGAMHDAGASVAEIDSAVRIDDDRADGAMRTLIGQAHAERYSEPGDGEPKHEIIFDLRSALGFRGLEHAYKNYVLDADPADRDRATRALAEARGALDRYSRHVATTAEVEALVVLAQALSFYEAAVIGGAIDERRAAGAGPSEIDAAVAPPVAEVLSALGVLDAAALVEERAARQQVSRALGYVASTSAATSWVVLGGALVMSVAAVWLLGFRVAPRLARLTKVTRALSQGVIQTEIPFTRDRDEIGEMSRALLVFRNSIESNIVMARELAESTRLASLGALVAGMAHELNTPIGNALSVASALGETLRHFSTELLSGKVRRSALEDFTRRTADASGLIERNLLRASQQIGSFKQIAVDQTGDQRRAYKLDRVLKDVVESMRPTVRRAHCAITLEAETGVDMDGYPGALTQVVCNLIENSIKHGLADRRDGAIVVSARRIDNETSEVVVSDDGVGIPEDLVERIFDAFFTTRPGKGGSGLGLHIVNMLVSRPLGGGVAVETAPGAGTRFILTLPNVAPEREAAPIQHAERVYYAAA